MSSCDQEFGGGGDLHGYRGLPCSLLIHGWAGLVAFQLLGKWGTEGIPKRHRWRGLIRSMYGTCTKLVAPPLIQLASSSVNPFVPGMMKRLFEA